jgi:hypothetical protein
MLIKNLTFEQTTVKDINHKKQQQYGQGRNKEIIVLIH